MKRLVLILIILSIMISSFSITNAATTTKVTVQSITLVKNDHVGNSWTKTVKVNDKTLSVGKEYKFSTSKLKAYAKIVENDKVPDIGTKTVSLVKGKTNTFDVTVTENRGRYSGNKAIWRIKIKVNW